MRSRWALLVLAAASFAMLAFAVAYLQGVVGLQPCPMCIVQRDALIAFGIFCVLAACFRGRGGQWTLGTLAILAGAFGAFTAARQSWLQWNPPAFATCGRDFYGVIESFPLRRAIPMLFKGSGDCSAVDWTFLGGSIANWSFVCFVALIAATLWVLARGRRA